MKLLRPRTIAKLLLFLLLGAIVNVAVAWTIGLSIDVGLNSATLRTGAQDRFGDEDVEYLGWLVFRHELPYALRVRSGWTDRGLGGGGSGGWPNGPAAPLIPNWASDYRPDNMKPTKSSHDVVIWEYGWPMRSLGGLVHVQQYGGNTTNIDRYCALPTDAALLNDPNDLWKLRLVAWLPLWPGFLVNSVFFAVALWGMVATPLAIRRWRRKGRGQCANCSYPIGISEVCTECGATVLHGRPHEASVQRQIVRACGIFALAALINVSVAWMLAFPGRAIESATRRGQFDSSQFSPDESDERWDWRMQLRGSTGWMQVHWSKRLHFLDDEAVEEDDHWVVDLPAINPPAWTIIEWWCPPWEVGEFREVTEFASGWPMHAFAGFIFQDDVYEMYCRDSVAIHVPGYDEDWRELRIIPLRPIWPGFAINTIFYAAVVCLLFIVPGSWRRGIRRRK